MCTNFENSVHLAESSQKANTLHDNPGTSETKIVVEGARKCCLNRVARQLEGKKLPFVACDTQNFEGGPNVVELIVHMTVKPPFSQISQHSHI